MNSSRRSALLGLAASAAFISTAPAPALALGKAQARAHVNKVAKRLLGIVSAGGSISTQKAAFRRFLLRDVAHRDVARLAIGRPWRFMSASQRNRYVNACVKYLTETYSKRFGEFGGMRFQLGGIVDSSSGEALVDSKLVSANGRRSFDIVWRIIDRGGRPKLLDVYVEEASLLITLKSEFGAILSRNGDDVEALIRQLSRG